MKTSDSEWQRVLQQVTTSNNKLERMTTSGATSDKEWHRMTMSGYFDQCPFFPEEATRHPKDNPLNLEEDLEKDLLN